MPPHDPQALLTDLQHTIEQVRTALSEGTLADASQIEPKLAAFMSALGKLEKEQARAYLPTLSRLDHALAELMSDYKRLQTSAGDALTTLTTRLQAAAAYTKRGGDEG